MQGYLLMAIQDQKYFIQAEHAARSIRFFDPNRHICLLCDDESKVSPMARQLFYKILTIDPDTSLRGTEHHLYLNRISPFDETLYIDADCLVTSPRILDVWLDIAEYHVTFPGRKLTTGEWRRLSVQDLMRVGEVDYVVQLNGGVFYFDKSHVSDRFFTTAQNFFEKSRHAITVKHGSGGGLANEPIWGLTMAKTKQKIFPLSYQLNVSTLRVEGWKIDSTPQVYLQKDQAEWQPIITHFLGLGGPKCPNELYNAFYLLVSGS